MSQQETRTLNKVENKFDPNFLNNLNQITSTQVTQLKTNLANNNYKKAKQNLAAIQTATKGLPKPSPLEWDAQLLAMDKVPEQKFSKKGPKVPDPDKSVKMVLKNGVNQKGILKTNKLLYKQAGDKLTPLYNKYNGIKEPSRSGFTKGTKISAYHKKIFAPYKEILKEIYKDIKVGKPISTKAYKKRQQLSLDSTDLLKRYKEHLGNLDSNSDGYKDKKQFLDAKVAQMAVINKNVDDFIKKAVELYNWMHDDPTDFWLHESGLVNSLDSYYGLENKKNFKKKEAKNIKKLLKSFLAEDGKEALKKWLETNPDPRSLYVVINSGEYKDMEPLIEFMEESLLGAKKEGNGRFHKVFDPDLFAKNKNRMLFMAMNWIDSESFTCEDHTTFLRENTAGTKLMKTMMAADPENMKFMDDMFNDLKKIDLSGDIEIHPGKIADQLNKQIHEINPDAPWLKDDSPEVKKVYVQNVIRFRNILNIVWSRIMKVLPPDCYCLLAYQAFTSLARIKDSRKEQLKLAGGIIFLRYINPELLIHVKDQKSKMEPEAYKEFLRKFFLVTKMLQNVSNNVKMGLKEKFMAPFMSWGAQKGKEMEVYLLETVDRGRKLALAHKDEIEGLDGFSEESVYTLNLQGIEKRGRKIQKELPAFWKNFAPGLEKETGFKELEEEYNNLIEELESLDRMDEWTLREWQDYMFETERTSYRIQMDLVGMKNPEDVIGTFSDGLGDIDLGGDHGNFDVQEASGLGLNCLIDSIGKALGHNKSDNERDTIRQTLVNGGLAQNGEFLYNDQPILRTILRELGENPDRVNIYFASRGSQEVDTFTYNNGDQATKTIYIMNEANVHFRPMISQDD